MIELEYQDIDGFLSVLKQSINIDIDNLTKDEIQEILINIRQHYILGTDVLQDKFSKAINYGKMRYVNYLLYNIDNIKVVWEYNTFSQTGLTFEEFMNERY